MWATLVFGGPWGSPTVRVIESGLNSVLKKWDRHLAIAVFVGIGVTRLGGESHFLAAS